MKIKVKVDDKICIGSGNCVVLASENFTLNKKGKAEVKSSEKGTKNAPELLIEVNAEEKEMVLEAARACPVQAISLFNEKGKQIST